RCQASAGAVAASSSSRWPEPCSMGGQSLSVTPGSRCLPFKRAATGQTVTLMLLRAVLTNGASIRALQLGGTIRRFVSEWLVNPARLKWGTGTDKWADSGGQNLHRFLHIHILRAKYLRRFNILGRCLKT